MEECNINFYLEILKSNRRYTEIVEEQNILDHVTTKLENNLEIRKCTVYQEVGTYREFPIYQKQFHLSRQSNEIHRLAQEHHGFELRFYDAKETHHQAIVSNKKIDKHCLDLVLLFKKLNIRTKVCSQGRGPKPYHIIFRDGTPMSVFESFINHLPLKGTFNFFETARGDESVKYEAPSIEAAEHDYQLMKAFISKEDFLPEKKKIAKRMNNTHRPFKLNVLLNDFKRNKFDFTHEVSEDNNMVNIHFNNSNIKHIEININERRATITRVNDEQTMYFFVYHNDLFTEVLEQNNIRL